MEECCPLLQLRRRADTPERKWCHPGRCRPSRFGPLCPQTWPESHPCSSAGSPSSASSCPDPPSGSGGDDDALRSSWTRWGSRCRLQTCGNKSASGQRTKSEKYVKINHWLTNCAAVNDTLQKNSVLQWKCWLILSNRRITYYIDILCLLWHSFLFITFFTFPFSWITFTPQGRVWKENSMGKQRWLNFNLATRSMHFFPSVLAFIKAWREIVSLHHAAVRQWYVL